MLKSIHPAFLPAVKQTSNKCFHCCDVGKRVGLKQNKANAALKHVDACTHKAKKENSQLRKKKTVK